MKLFSIGGIAIMFNLFFGFVNIMNGSTNVVYSTFGMVCMLIAGVLIGMSMMGRFVRH
jgi:hypothetical protein